MADIKYTIDGEEVPRVSSIVKDDAEALLHWMARGAAQATEEVGGDALTGLAEWEALRRDTMDAGTWCHHLIARHLGSEELPPDVSLSAEHRGEIAFTHWLEWFETMPIERTVYIEKQMVNAHLRYGGTPDLVWRHADGGLWVSDWKTSERPKIRHDHLVQGAGYMLMVDAQPELAGEQVRGFQVCALGQTTTARTVSQSFTQEDMGPFMIEFMTRRAAVEARSQSAKRFNALRRRK